MWGKETNLKERWKDVTDPDILALPSNIFWWMITMIWQSGENAKLRDQVEVKIVNT